MALTATIKESTFGVGDTVRVHLKYNEGDKSRNQFFDGIVISVKRSGPGKTFTVRKIAEGRIGVEMIFPFDTPSLEKVEVVKHGTEGVKQAKLYYIRSQSPREIEKIYSRAAHKNVAPKAAKAKKKVTKSTKSVSATGRKVASKKK